MAAEDYEVPKPQGLFAYGQTRILALLESRGCREAFIRRREELKRQGMHAELAWRVAAREMVPDVALRLVGRRLRALPGIKEYVDPNGGLRLQTVHQALKASGRVVPQLVAEVVPVERQRDEDEDGGDEIQPVRIFKPGGVTLDGVDVGDFQGAEAAKQAIIDWVASRIRLANVQPADCPCPAAWNMLQWVRESTGNEETFWSRIYSQMLPSRQQIDRAEEIRDSGRAAFELLDNVLDALSESEARAARAAV